jgi:uridine phosphorylase
LKRTLNAITNQKRQFDPMAATSNDNTNEETNEETNEDANAETKTKFKRGYSFLEMTGEPRVQGASIHSNVLIKNSLPARGVVSSNPLRIERLLRCCGKDSIGEPLLKDIKIHTDSGWGIRIWTAVYQGVEMFVAIVPMGSTGAGFCFWEMYSAQAQAILRLGANDVTGNGDVVICHEADNLISLPHAAGDLQYNRETVLEASCVLVHLLQQNDPQAKKLIVHNVEDYHAYNFSECLPDGGKHIREFITRLKEKGDCCFDMESATLFYRAKQFGLHAATVLVPTKESSNEVETEHYKLLFQTLIEFTPETQRAEVERTGSLARMARRLSTNDLIGVEEPLYYNDVEVGNNMFNDDDDEALVF